MRYPKNRKSRAVSYDDYPGPKRRPAYDRVMERTIPVPFCGCLLFLGSTSDKGYGQVGAGSVILGDARLEPAHRVVYEHHHGELPREIEVRHRCDVPLCVEITHLESGTHKENMQDSVKRGRNTRGEKCSFAKLTEDDVRAIRTSKLSSHELSKVYPVSAGNIRKHILTRKTWAHI